MDNFLNHAENAMTPRSLAESNISLNIPIYQRLFVWEEDQINLLLEDLFSSSSSALPYYIGIITIVQKNSKCDVVDGQQRLTFLSLFAAYVCRHDEQYPQQANQWRSFLFNGNELRINYTGRPEDREQIKNIANKSEIEIVNRNFRIFIECMNRFCSKLTPNFIDYVYNQASFLVSMLPENFEANDLNLFFEKMNSAGRQLTPVEQIKGKYFPGNASIFEACLNFEKRFKDEGIYDNNTFNPSETGAEIADNSKKSLENIISNLDVEEKIENNEKISMEEARSVLSAEIFLLHSLYIAGRRLQLTNQKIIHNERTILTQFRTYVGRGANQILPIELLKSMSDYRKFLDNNIIFLKNASDGSFEYYLRDEDEMVESQQPDCEEDKQKKLYWKNMKQLQSMLYVSSSSWQEWVLDAYWAQQPITINLLKNQDNARHFQISISDTDEWNYHHIDRYWFWKLDYILWELFTMSPNNKLFTGLINDDERSAIREYKFRSNRSIEHLHPQTDGDAWEDADKHGFGNLAMISSSFNSTQQNDTVSVKFARLHDTQIPQRSLESIKLLLMFAEAGRKEEGWTTAKAQAHKAEMLDLLKEYYAQENK